MNKDLKPRKKSSTGEIEKGMVVTGYGIDVNGFPITYYGHVSLAASHDNLKSLKIYEGAQDVHLEGNFLTSVEFPDSVEYVLCEKELFDYDTCKVTVVDIRYETL